MVTREQFINGLVNYADSEIMPFLPTSGKWLAGSVIIGAMKRSDAIFTSLLANPVVSVLGIFDDKGMIDIDLVTMALKEAATKYGKLTVSFPVIGNLTFSESDIEQMREYICKV